MCNNCSAVKEKNWKFITTISSIPDCIDFGIWLTGKIAGKYTGKCSLVVGYWIKAKNPILQKLA
jgi:hypothetical protein